MPFLVRWPGVIKPGSRQQGADPEHRLRPDLPRDRRRRDPRRPSRAAACCRSSRHPAGSPPAGATPSTTPTTARAPTTSPPTTASRTERYKLIYFPDDQGVEPVRPREGPAGDALGPRRPGLRRRCSSRPEGTLRRPARRNTAMSEATLPADRNDRDWWKKRHQQKLKEVKKGGHDLVFIGDSITQGWEGAGKETWDKYYGRAQGPQPRLLRRPHRARPLAPAERRTRERRSQGRRPHDRHQQHRPPQQDPPKRPPPASSASSNCSATARPDTKILLLSASSRATRNPTARCARSTTASTPSSRPTPTASTSTTSTSATPSSTDDGTLPKEIMPDFLHPKQKGYAIWAEAIESKLCELGGWTPIE